MRMDRQVPRGGCTSCFSVGSRTCSGDGDRVEDIALRSGAKSVGRTQKTDCLVVVEGKKEPGEIKYKMCDASAKSRPGRAYSGHPSYNGRAVCKPAVCVIQAMAGKRVSGNKWWSEPEMVFLLSAD